MSATVAAAARLRALIGDGRVAPGDKLSEREMTGALGISRNTLREVFSTLESELLITRVPHRGVFVAQLSAASIRETYATRRLLEPAAALWGDTALVLPALRDAAAEMLAARDASDATRMADANQRFHRHLVSCTGSIAVVETMDKTLARMRMAFAHMRGLDDFHAPYAALNAELCGLLQDDRREDAATFLRAYLDRAERELLDHYSRQHG